METDIAMIEEQATKITPLVRAKVLPDDFDDVMQDIKISLWISLPNYRGEAVLSTYAYTIAKHRIADHWRKAYCWRKAIKAMAEDHPAVLSWPESSKGNGGRLSPAEKEVFRLLGQGMGNAEICAALYRNISTVRSHLKKIYKKFGCRDRVKVALLANRIFREEEK